jgi:hypothetical protein
MLYTKHIIKHLIFFSGKERGTDNEFLRKEIQFKWILNKHVKNRLCIREMLDDTSSTVIVFHAKLASAS